MVAGVGAGVGAGKQCSQVPTQQSKNRKDLVGPGERQPRCEAHGQTPTHHPPEPSSRERQAQVPAGETMARAQARPAVAAAAPGVRSARHGHRTIYKGCKRGRGAVSDPPMAKPLLSFSPENALKSLLGESRLEGNAEVTLKVDSSLTQGAHMRSLHRKVHTSGPYLLGKSRSSPLKETL